VFTEVEPGEGPTALAMFANVFLVLCAYYFVKPLRDGWIATSDVAGLSKMEVKAYTSLAQSLCLVGVAAAYAKLAAHATRSTLIAGSTLFCITNLVAFWLLRRSPWGDHAAAGVVFYVWVGMFGLFVVSQFWAFAADLYTEERGKRLLPMVAIGATGGAVAGSYLTGAILETGRLESEALLLAAIAPLALSIGLMRVAHRRGATGDGPGAAASEPAAGRGGGRASDAFALVLRHRYLLAVAVITLLTHWVNTNGENLLFRVVQEGLERALAAREAVGPDEVKRFVREGTTAFYGGFFFWVNTTALVLQAFVASRLLRWGGFGWVLLLLPVLALGVYSVMALVPSLLVVRALKIAENGTNYSINNTAAQVLWLPTGREMKYKAKPAIETLCVRLGDGLAALTVWLGVQGLALSTSSFFAANVALAAAWLAVGVFVVREHGRLVGRSASEPAG
jgi:AAA family ATP:ADP antiporter